MDRRELVTGGLAMGGALLFGANAFGDDSNVDAFADSGSGDGKGLVGQEILGHKIDTFGTENIVTAASTAAFQFLTVNFGNIARGTHAREFNVPRGTQLVLGQVQEGLHAGDARYATLGIAVRAEQTGDWRCRVIWKMSWSSGSALPTYGRFILIRG